MTSAAARAAAEHYIRTEWGDDGAAVSETASRGRLSDTDLREIEYIHGDRHPSFIDAVKDALLEVCIERSAGANRAGT